MKQFFFLYFWLCWVFAAVLAFLPGCGEWGLLSSRAQAFVARASAVVAPMLRFQAPDSSAVHGPRCSWACGVFLAQGSNPGLLHWQGDSSPLSHQGSPTTVLISEVIKPRRTKQVK